MTCEPGPFIPPPQTQYTLSPSLSGEALLEETSFLYICGYFFRLTAAKAS